MYMKVKVLVSQSCLTLCNPMNCTSVHGILQARILEGLLFPSPGDLPDPGIQPGSPALQADSLPSEPPRKPCMYVCMHIYIEMFHKSDIHFYVYGSLTFSSCPLLSFVVTKSTSSQHMHIFS